MYKVINKLVHTVIVKLMCTVIVRLVIILVRKVIVKLMFPNVSLLRPEQSSAREYPRKAKWMISMLTAVMKKQSRRVMMTTCQYITRLK